MRLRLAGRATYYLPYLPRDYAKNLFSQKPLYRAVSGQNDQGMYFYFRNIYLGVSGKQLGRPQHFYGYNPFDPPCM